MLTYVANVNSIKVIDDNGKNYTITDKYILEKVKEIINKSERVIQTKENNA